MIALHPEYGLFEALVGFRPRYQWHSWGGNPLSCHRLEQHVRQRAPISDVENPCHTSH